MQVIFSFFTLLANLYCLVSVIVVKALRRSDFYFIFAQKVVDFSIGGDYSLAFGLSQLKRNFDAYCSSKDSLEAERQLDFLPGR